MIKHIFDIRASTLADAEAVTKVLAASYSDLLAGYYDAKLLEQVLPLISMANPALLITGTYYVAVAGDVGIVGCGGWTFRRPGDGAVVKGVAHVRHFGTHPLWTRQGVAKAILTKCIEEAEARGAGAMECYSTLAAVEFYQRMGFAAANPIDVELKPGLFLPSIFMKRTGVLQ